MGRRGRTRKTKKEATTAASSTLAVTGNKSNNNNHGDLTVGKAPDIKQLAKVLDLKVSEELLDYATSSQPCPTTRERLQRKVYRQSLTNYAAAALDYRKSCHKFQVTGHKYLQRYSNYAMEEVHQMAQEQCQKKKNGNGETGAKGDNNDDGDDPVTSPTPQRPFVALAAVLPISVVGSWYLPLVVAMLVMLAMPVLLVVGTNQVSFPVEGLDSECWEEDRFRWVRWSVAMAKSWHWILWT